jgi:hypothetical protein
VQSVFYSDGTSAGSTIGVSDVCDDRWHFAVATYDGTALRTYVDGVWEAAWALGSTPIFPGTAPVNIGGFAADSGTAVSAPHYGRVDEAFVTGDVLTEDEIRSLYAARIIHTLGAQPKTVSLNVRRARKGAALLPGDFTTQPVRLHNFTAGALTDQGSGNVALINAGTAPISVAGADGTLGNGFAVGASGTAHFAAPDTGLPSALLTRSYGCWFKTASTGSGNMIAWGGAINSAETRIGTSGGQITSNNGTDGIAGPYVNDGQWHFAVMVEDSTAADGVKRKLYVDGRLVGVSTAMNGITLTGAGRFRIGAAQDGSNPFTGTVDTAFVCAYALSQEEITRLYIKAGQPLAASPKNAGDHTEGFDSGSLLFIGDTLDAQHSLDLTVS